MGILKTPSLVVIAALLAFVPLDAGELRVDINRDSNNTTIVTETGYVRWSPDSTNGAASGTNAISRSFTTAAGENVTVTFIQTVESAAAGGTGLLSNWYKAGAEGGAKLVSDGLTVAPANLAAGGQMRMTITGLNAGAHTLLSYHNAWDNLAAGSLGPIDIHVNGLLAHDNLQPSIRAATNSAAATAYLSFNVAGPADVTEILFAAETNTAAGVTIRNVMINGFEIDTPNAVRIAHTPSPADADAHADADSGSVTLSWSPAIAGGVVSHYVYFGTDEAAVASATHTSPLFLGNQAATSRVVPVGGKHATYYWRIDEIDTLGNVVAGTVWSFRPRLLAFPGAEGHGRFAHGGRGGRVVHIASLADYGSGDTPVPGTLRHAIEVETGPRVIVFDVGGLITLNRRLTLNSPFVTIAGQTAPGKGICLRQWALGLSGANDCVVRFLRNRPGDISGQTIDGGGLAGCDHSIMDHCSISWSMDEGFSSRGGKNITLQRTLISEALAIAGHQNYPAGTDHGYAATVGGDIASLHHNLLAHCSGRNWSLGGGVDAAGYFSGRLDIRNNVVYNWRSRTTDGGAMEVNFVNNYYKPGAATTLVPYAVTMNHENDFGGSQRCYFAGNVMQGHFNEANQTLGRRSVVSNGAPPPTYETFVAAPFFDHHVNTQTALGAYKRVLSDVGANRPLDSHDARVIQETLAGTYTYTGTGPFGGYPGLPNSQADVGGWEDYPSVARAADWDSDGDGLPAWWEALHGTNPTAPAGDFSEANADPENDGFTRLDEYLAWMALPQLETSSGATVDLDLSTLTKGYSASPVRQVQLAPASTGAGTVQMLSNGRTVRFTAAAGFSGLARFTHAVSDSAEDSMSGEVGVRVIAAAAPPPQPVTPVFVKLATTQVSAGSTPAAATTSMIDAPGSGWNYSAAAPVAGTKWNLIQRPNPLIGSNSSNVVGQYVCNSANHIALTSSSGGATTTTLTVSLDIQDLESGTSRVEPNAAAAGTTMLGPSGLMSQCWRIYRGGNGSIHRLEGLPAGAHCYLYVYGTTTTTGQGCKFILNAANVPGGDGITKRFVEVRGGNLGNVFVSNGGTCAPTPPAPVDTVSTASDNNSWGRLHAVVDGSGALVFHTAKNADNGQYINGYQVVPFPLPVISVQPPPTALVTLGTDISLVAAATGEGTLTYQWRKDGQPITGNPSALTSKLDLAGVSATVAGVYELVVSNEGGSVSSQPVTLAVTHEVIGPEIQVPPSNVNAKNGDLVLFSVSVNGTTPLSYQWEKSVDGVNYEPVAGGTASSLAIASVQLTDAGWYRVRVTNSAGSVTSQGAMLTLEPVIVIPPAGGMVVSGSPRTVSVTADAGAGNPQALSYVWKKGGVTLMDGGGLSGATTASLQFSSFTLANSGLYTVTVSNPAGSVTTTAVYLGVPTSLATTRFPVAGAASVNRDTTLRLKFQGGTPVVGSTGRIRLFRASDDALVESIDLAGATTLSQKSITDAANVSYRYVPRSIGGNTYKCLPVVIAGDIAIVSFSNPALLSHGQSYYVKMDAGAILDSTGATYPAIDDKTTWTFTVKPSGPKAGAIVLRVSADGSKDFTTVQGAIEHVPTTNLKRVTILVAAGDYYEYVVVKNRPLIALRGSGENAAATRIAYLVNNNVYNLPPSSAHLGARAVFTVEGSPDFVADNLTIQNLTAKGGSQAEAVVTRSGSPRCFFNKVRVLSYQDTMLPDRIHVKDSYIEGDVDFMWGGGVSFYENCEIKAMSGGYYAQYRTSSASSYGGIYVNCRFTASAGLGAGTQVLNRINPVDYPHAQMVLIDCAMGTQVKSNPWQLDGGAITAPTIRLWEYKSTDLAGALLNVSGRPSFNAIATGVGSSTVLPNQQIDQATASFLRVPGNIFDGWTPVLPAMPTAYEEFSAIHGLDPGTSGLPDADPESDGLVNALEFLLGGDPLANDARNVSPLVSLDAGGGLVFTYERKIASGGIYADKVETSDQLGPGTWTDVAHGVAGVIVDVVALNAETELVTVHLPPGSEKRFARLRASGSP